MNWLIATILLMLPLLSGEFLSKKIKNPEYSRKFVHISAGIVVAFLPLFLELNQIAIIAVIFTPPMIFAKWKSLMSSMSGVSRKTYGEVVFSIGVAIAAVLAISVEAFLFGVLVMALADGFATVIGKAYGKKKFTLLGSTKSYVGSFSFFAITLIIGLALIGVLDLGFDSVAILVAISGLLAAIEATSPLGLDNLTIPIAATLLFGIIV